MGSWVLMTVYVLAPVSMLAALTKLVSNPDFARVGRLLRSADGLLHRPGRAARSGTPVGRPIEEIAYDARRLGRQLRHEHDGRSALRIEAIRRSYDDVLGEGCQALGFAHLLGVLPLGTELDAERERVEVVLVGAGMVLAENA